MGGSTRTVVAATSDEALAVAAAQHGDPAAFGALMAQHRTILWAVCLRVTGNAFDAEDALQETLVDAWRGLPGFRAESKVSTWLYRVASNAALRVACRRRDTPVDVLPHARVDRDFAQVVADADAVHRALRQVPEDFRVALVLFELCDFTYAQIAAHQGVGVQTVKSRISRGRAALTVAASTQR